MYKETQFYKLYKIRIGRMLKIIIKGKKIEIRKKRNIKRPSKTKAIIRE